MKFTFSILSFPLLLLLLLDRVALLEAQAVTPPRGWNSYDSFVWIISEEEFLQNAELVSQRLKSYGYEYVVVDYRWYRRKVPGAETDSNEFDVIDEWGRVVPDPDRWPSSKGGKGFREVANKVHSMGLKFGIHIMRGISTQAVNANTPILDTKTGGAYMEGGKKWTASDIGLKERACVWMSQCFMSVDTKLAAGRAFLQSLYEQYAEWGVDFIKHDCVFGEDLDYDEIHYVSEVLRKLSRPMLYSISPGSSVTLALAKVVAPLVNMYRVTEDGWDTWGDVAAHFDVSRDFVAANMTGSTSLMGKSWPDLDMLPFGWLTDSGSTEGPHRSCKLRIEEQKTQMTLWAMAKSPLMFGGDMRKLDDSTYSLITNPTILEINAFSSNNMEFPFITASHALKTIHHDKGHKTKGGHKIKEGGSHTNSLTLVSCKETKASGWSIEALDQDHDQVCWKDTKKHIPPFCVYKRKPRVTDDEVGYNTQYTWKSQLLASTKEAVCLGASSKRRLTSKEIKRGSLSTCKQHANQMWELDINGTLINSFSGLCATVRAQANDAPVGVRSWVATGRKGEVYVALFNLNPVAATVSAQLSDLPKVLPGLRPVRAVTSYRCTEVWSGKDCQINRGSISMNVQPHGAALVVLT